MIGGRPMIKSMGGKIERENILIFKLLLIKYKFVRYKNKTVIIR